MKLLLVSGIFGAPPAFRERALQETGETLLLDGLRARGVDVQARAPRLREDWSGFDVVHLNHLTNSCVRTLAPFAPALVFTRHSTKPIPAHKRLVLASTYRASDGIVVMTETEAGLHPPSVPRDRVHVISNGVDTRHFWPALRTAPKPGRPWQLLAVGQLVEFKRVHLAIDLVAQLASEGVDARLRIVYHRDTLQPDLEAHAAARGVEDRVTFVGARSRDELGDELRTAHVLVHPSRTEAQPTVVSEAALTGLPVLCFRVGGVEEQVAPGTELPLPGEVDRWTALAGEITRSYETTAARAFAHAATARRLFSVEAMVDRHLELYSSLVAAAR